MSSLVWIDLGLFQPQTFQDCVYGSGWKIFAAMDRDGNYLTFLYHLVMAAIGTVFLKTIGFRQFDQLFAIHNASLHQIIIRIYVFVKKIHNIRGTMQKGQQYINKKKIQAAVLSLAKQLAEVPDRDRTTSHAFLWGAAAAAYMSGAYDVEAFEDVRDEAYRAYDLFEKKIAAV